MPDGGWVSSAALMAELSADGGLVSSAAVMVEVSADGGLVSAAGLMVELEWDHWGRVSAVALMVEFEADVAPPMVALNAEVQDVLAEVLASEARLRALIEGQTQTTQDLRHLQASLLGYRVRVRAVRESLDRRRVGTALPAFVPAGLLNAARWERALRGVLVRLDYRLRQALDVLTALLLGREGRLYAVRTGDTLQRIAERELGGWARWREIEALNGITPGDLTPGSVIRLPDREPS